MNSGTAIVNYDERHGGNVMDNWLRQQSDDGGKEK